MTAAKAAHNSPGESHNTIFEPHKLRPRAGRSRMRPLYGRAGDAFVIVAIGPEALIDRRGFDRAVRVARQRLAEIEE